MITQHNLSYLALGDSYTIGEAVPIHESFPYLLVQRFRAAGLPVSAPEVVARTGWTTDELLGHMSSIKLLESYDIVTILVGVNNQYRGYSVETFEVELYAILREAIKRSQLSSIAILSIPNWGLTPFAADRDTGRIGREIAEFNFIAETIAHSQGVHYIDVGADGELNKSALAEDGLHYSGQEYLRWSGIVFDKLMESYGSQTKT